MENWFQEGQSYFSTLAEQSSPGMLSDHPVRSVSMVEHMSPGLVGSERMNSDLVGSDIGIISSLASGVQPRFDMTGELITQVSQ